MNIEFRLPNIDENLTPEQKIEQLQSYIYQLVQKLNWAFNANDNEQSAISAQNDKKTNELKSEIEDQEGHMSVVQQTADKLSTKVSNFEGQVSEFEQTVEGFNTTVNNYQGQVSQFNQTVTGFNTKVSNYEGQVSTFNQTVNGFQSTVSNYQGQVSSFQQTVEGFNLRGYITATDVGQTGSTIIDGSRIQTGTIDASRVNIKNLLKIGYTDDFTGFFYGIRFESNGITLCFADAEVTLAEFENNTLYIGEKYFPTVVRGAWVTHDEDV